MANMSNTAFSRIHEANKLTRRDALDQNQLFCVNAYKFPYLNPPPRTNPLQQTPYNDGPTTTPLQRRPYNNGPINLAAF